mgnify:CR=1 FL=1
MGCIDIHPIFRWIRREEMVFNIIAMIIIIMLIMVIAGYKKEFKSIAKQIDNHLDDYVNIRTSTSDKDLDRLVSKINLLYDRRQKVNAEKKKVEEDLRASISNMSHDLRTPLTSIMGYMQLVRSPRISDKDKEEYMDIIESRTKSLQALISSFYELSRIEGNEYKFDYKKINLSALLCENIASFYNDFMTNGIEPIIEINEKVSDIIADENAVNRIFANLINNMIKHGKSFVKISLREEGKIIVSEFINGAPDLSEEDLEKIFDRFYTVDKSRSDRNTGLGLCITRSLVTQLGHEIKAKLEDGKLVISITWNIRN